MTLKQLLLVLFVLHGVQQSHGNEREPRSPKFTAGPNRELCILSSHSDERFYEYTNEDGRQCKCDLCDQGKILVQNCTICDPVTTQSSTCKWVSLGVQRMPYVNKCTTGFDCKQCLPPSIVIRRCSPRGHRDTICGCPDGFFKAQEDLCKPLPRCDAGSEPRPGPGDVEAEMICQPCSDGFFQPNNNSTDKCRIHTNCVKVVGTKISDYVCQNYQSAVSSTESSPNLPFPELVISTSIPTTSVPTTSVPTTSVPTTTGTNPLASDVPWYFLVFGIVIGFGLGFALALRISKNQTGSYNAASSDDTELSNGDTSGPSTSAQNSGEGDTSGPSTSAQNSDEGDTSGPSTRVQIPDEDTQAEQSTLTNCLRTPKDKNLLLKKIRLRGKGRRH